MKVDEAACPFCHAAFAAPLVPSSGDGARRIPRVAAIALVAGVSSAAGCSAAYGVAMEDSGIPGEDAGVVDAGDDDDAGAGAPEYGAPADDAGG